MKLRVMQFKFIILVLIGVYSLNTQVMAQVTIGSGIAPNENALLDLKEGDNQPATKGLLLPRVELKALTSSYPLKAHVKGMFVYNLKDVDNNIFPGCYYNTGTEWARVGAGSSVDLQISEVSLNNLWKAATGWNILDQDFHSYGKIAHFIIKLQRIGTDINIWDKTNNPMLIAEIANVADKAMYKPVSSIIDKTSDISINCLASFPKREISTMAESEIDFDGNILIRNVKESIGTFMNMGAVLTDDIIVVSGSYYIK